MPGSQEPPFVTLGDVRAAAARIAGRVVRTPLVPFAAAEPGRPLWLKPESLQPTGAFKLRGAFNAILQRLDDARAHGVVTHSSGNHARAVAWVARELGLRAVIAMPDAAPAVKVDAVRRLGAEVVTVTPEERDTRAFELAAEHGYVMIPPYDDVAVVAGQGTVGLEIAADLPGAGAVLVPVSGGGLIGGVATAVKALSPATRVIGVEPELAGDAAESFRTGERVAWTAAQTYRTVADGLRTTSVGEIPWRQIQQYVDDVITVSEAEILDGVRRLAADARLVAEPSGAVAFTAYLHRTGKLGTGSPLVAVVSGGNIAAGTLAGILSAPARPASGAAGDQQIREPPDPSGGLEAGRPSTGTNGGEQALPGAVPLSAARGWCLACRPD
ncbi:MAG: threonine/serine dehydratase, partial [Actinobacteria bacterium]|nr:threonine/serine dehydratase [Actinomycetota bacterium]